MKEDKEFLIFSGLIAATLLIALVGWVAGSAMEARSFNRVTGQDVSTVDAMFVKLRVDGGKQCPPCECQP